MRSYELLKTRLPHLVHLQRFVVILPVFRAYWWVIPYIQIHDNIQLVICSTMQSDNKIIERNKVILYVCTLSGIAVCLCQGTESLFWPQIVILIQRSIKRVIIKCPLYQYMMGGLVYDIVLNTLLKLSSPSLMIVSRNHSLKTAVIEDCSLAVHSCIKPVDIKPYTWQQQGFCPFCK